MTAFHIDVVRGRRGRPAILLRQSYRDGKTVRKRTLANISDWPSDQVDGLRALLKGTKLSEAPGADRFKFEIVRTRPHGHVLAVLETIRQLGVDELVERRSSRERDLVIAMVAARVLFPSSKLATSRGLDPRTITSTLGESLDLVGADVDELYAAMDWLLERKEGIERQLVARHLESGGFALYDSTSTYFEGRCCVLAKLGHSRDEKSKNPQIVIGLLCDMVGRPLAVEVFAGNTSDPKTITSQITKLREKYQLEHVIVVGDRGMLTNARIVKDLQSNELDWVTALRAPAIKKLVENGRLQLTFFDDMKIGEITVPEYPGERLVVCRNPFLVAERARKREELLCATERKLDQIVAATRREKRRLEGRDKIGLRIGRVLSRYKVGKHFRINIRENSFSYSRRLDQIKAEAALDGFYVLRTSLSDDVLGTEEVLETYKSLASVERAFRSIKTVDLKVRPIYHRIADRVRAHVFICTLAYYVEWHMRDRLGSLLFDDTRLDEASRKRESAVDPAERSDDAKAKASRKQTKDGRPVQSFQDLLRDLSTIAKNRIKPDGLPEFDMITTPTPHQQEALRLLGVRLA